MRYLRASVLILALLSPLTLTLAVAAPPKEPCRKACAPPPATILGQPPNACAFDPNGESRCCMYPQVVEEGNKKQECIIVACQPQCELPWEMVKRLCKPPVEKFDI